MLVSKYTRNVYLKLGKKKSTKTLLFLLSEDPNMQNSLFDEIIDDLNYNDPIEGFDAQMNNFSDLLSNNQSKSIDVPDKCRNLIIKYRIKKKYLPLLRCHILFLLYQKLIESSFNELLCKTIFRAITRIILEAIKNRSKTENDSL